MKSQNLQTLRKVIRSIIVEADDKPDEFGGDPNLYRGPDGRVYRILNPSDFDKIRVKLPDIKDLTLSDADLSSSETDTPGYFYRPSSEVLANPQMYNLTPPERVFSRTPVMNPKDGKMKPHWGVDLTLTSGTENVSAIAVADGTIFGKPTSDEVASPDATGPGNQVKIKLNDGSIVVYMHLLSVNPKIQEGVTVKANDEIGTVGRTGGSTGPHLHFEWYKQPPTSIKDNAIDPLERLRQPGYSFPFAVPIMRKY